MNVELWRTPLRLGCGIRTTEALLTPDHVDMLLERTSSFSVQLLLPALKRTNGLVCYDSDIADTEPVFATWNPLGMLLAKARERGMTVYGWLCVFREGEGSSLLAKHPNLRAMDPDGRNLEWACPAQEGSSDYILSIVAELLEKYPLDGLLLDHVRYKGPEMCYCAHCRAEFEEDTGHDPAKIEADNDIANHWVNWRAGRISRLVEKVRGIAKASRTKLAASVFPSYPECVSQEGQDWVDWCNRGLVDQIFVMNYTSQIELFTERVADHLDSVPSGFPVWEVLGKKTSISRLTAQELAEQARCAAALECEGVVAFPYSSMRNDDFDAIQESIRPS